MLGARFVRAAGRPLAAAWAAMMVLLAWQRAWVLRGMQVGLLLGTADLDDVPIHGAQGIRS